MTTERPGGSAPLIQAPGRPSDPPKEPPRARTASAATRMRAGSRDEGEPRRPSPGRATRVVGPRTRAATNFARAAGSGTKSSITTRGQKILRVRILVWDSQSHENARRTAVRDDAPRDEGKCVRNICRTSKPPRNPTPPGGALGARLPRWGPRDTQRPGGGSRSTRKGGRNGGTPSKCGASGSSRTRPRWR